MYAFRDLRLWGCFCVVFLFADRCLAATTAVTLVNHRFTAQVCRALVRARLISENTVYEIFTKEVTVASGETKVVTVDDLGAAFPVEEWDSRTAALQVQTATSANVGNSEVATGGVDWFEFAARDPWVDGIPWSKTLEGDGAGGYAANPQDRKTLWIVDDTDLTADVYREGVDKIVAFTAERSAAGGAGGAAQTAFYDQHARLSSDLANATADGNAIMTQLDVETASGVAVTDLMALFPEDLVPENIPTVTGYELATPSPPAALTVQMPAAFGGNTINFNPFTTERLGPVADWFRYALEWLILVVLGIWVFKENKSYVLALGGVQQAKGNPVFGGTGAQATALIAAGIMSAIVVVFVTALLAWSFGGLNMVGFVSKIGVNPFLGLLADSFWMLTKVYPVEVTIAALLARLTFNAYASPLYLVCLTAVRFVIP